MKIKVNNNLTETIPDESLEFELKAALDMCNQLDEPQKSIFATILRSLQLITGKRQSYDPKVENRDIEMFDAPEYVKNLCKATKMDAEDLEYLFNFKDEFLELATIAGKNWEEKQINASLCVITANYYCFGNSEMTSSDLAEQLKKIKMGSMANLSKNLGKYTHFIDAEEVHRTQKIYKIKGPGKKEGIKIIKEQILNQKGESNE